MTESAICYDCGYCGQDFQIRSGEPDDVCHDCLTGPNADQIAEDVEYAAADQANDAELEREALDYERELPF